MLRYGNNFSVLIFLFCLLFVASFSTIVVAYPIDREAEPLFRVKSSHINPAALGSYNPYFTPADIKLAYGLPTSGGSGTIAIISAYDDPKIASDLATFSSQWGLPAANLEVHKMSTFMRGDQGWALETSLDVEWAHAIAPNAKILLVEARSASTTDLLSAINYARNRPDVVAISMSWGTPEFNGQTAYDSYFTSSYGASFFASAGDNSGVVEWPGSSINVVSVGGTTLTQTSTGYTETAWSSSGGGVSTKEPKPTYQTALPYSNRATPDVAYNADPATGFLVLDSYGYGGSGGWFAVGGTSAGAPQWAAIHALGLSASNVNFYAAYPQCYNVDFTDITSGTSGSYAAGPNYDLVTGIGTPIGVSFGAPPALPTPDFSLSASPTTLTILAGSQATTTVTATAMGGFSGDVVLETTVPAGWATPSPITLTPTASAQLTITVPSTVSVGTYQVNVQGTSGTSTKTLALTVQVSQPDFGLSANPSSISVRRGSFGTTQITLTAINGYSGSASLSTSGQPRGMTCSFNPSTVQSGLSATMRVSVAFGVGRGTYTVTVSAADAALGLVRTVAVRVTVR